MKISKPNLLSVLTISIIEDHTSEVVEAKDQVHGRAGLQVVFVTAVMLMQLVQHTLICALGKQTNHVRNCETCHSLHNLKELC